MINHRVVMACDSDIAPESSIASIDWFVASMIGWRSV